MTFQQTFVRQKTPHPKELKAKAQKLFNLRDRSNVSGTATDGDATAENNGVALSAEDSAAASNGIGNGSANHVGDEESEEVSGITQ